MCEFAHGLTRQRSLPGPPLTEQNAIAALAAHKVTVGVGVPEQWASRNIRFDIAWVRPVLHILFKYVLTFLLGCAGGQRRSVTLRCYCPGFSEPGETARHQEASY